MNATTKTLTAGEVVAKGDLLYSALHGRFVRFLRWADSYAAMVCDRDTMEELPDYVHPTQLERC
ncbi:MAG TPA: hypothetical protein VFW33_08605 [Gemmataceae bacterium]|nr:hypothetical protein [Gemmataceae bacterium]